MAVLVRPANRDRTRRARGDLAPTESDTKDSSVQERMWPSADAKTRVWRPLA